MINRSKDLSYLNEFIKNIIDEAISVHSTFCISLHIHQDIALRITKNPKTIRLAREQDEEYNLLITRLIIEYGLLLIKTNNEKLKRLIFKLDFFDHQVHKKILNDFSIVICENHTISDLTLISINNSDLDFLAELFKQKNSITHLGLYSLEKGLNFNSLISTLSTQNTRISCLFFECPIFIDNNTEKHDDDDEQQQQFKNFCHFIKHDKQIKKIEFNYQFEKRNFSLFHDAILSNNIIEKFGFINLHHSNFLDFQLFLENPKNTIRKLLFKASDIELNESHIPIIFESLSRSSFHTKITHLTLRVAKSGSFGVLFRSLDQKCPLEKIAVYTTTGAIDADFTNLSPHIEKLIRVLETNKSIVEMILGNVFTSQKIFIKEKYDKNCERVLYDPKLHSFDYLSLLETRDIYTYIAIKKLLYLQKLILCNRVWQSLDHSTHFTTKKFKAAIFSFVLCLNSRRRTHCIKIPKQILFLIIISIERKTFLKSFKSKKYSK